jgi:hypothetical protein
MVGRVTTLSEKSNTARWRQCGVARVPLWRCCCWLSSRSAALLGRESRQRKVGECVLISAARRMMCGWFGWVAVKVLQSLSTCLTLATHTRSCATPLSFSTGFKHVTCGSTIKLQFDGIGGGQFRLQSHEVA